MATTENKMCIENILKRFPFFESDMQKKMTAAQRQLNLREKTKQRKAGKVYCFRLHKTDTHYMSYH